VPSFKEVGVEEEKKEAPKPEEEPKAETAKEEKKEAPKPEEEPKAETETPSSTPPKEETSSEPLKEKDGEEEGKKGPSKPEKVRPTNCVKCNKVIKNNWWYYRNGKYYCNKRCWKAEKVQLEQEKAAKEREAKEQESAQPQTESK
jgi:hypothetical protein